MTNDVKQFVASPSLDYFTEAVNALDDARERRRRAVEELQAADLRLATAEALLEELRPQALAQSARALADYEMARKERRRDK